MKHEERKAAIAAYKKRNPPVGVFAFSCAATGAIWIGTSTDLDKIENRHRFTLKTGGHPHKGLQQAWNACGGGGFTFKIICTLKDDEAEFAMTRDRLLKEMLAAYRERLGADLL